MAVGRAYVAGALTLCVAHLALRATPWFLYVGGYPNGANPNQWWWNVSAAVNLILLIYGFLGLLLTAVLGASVSDGVRHAACTCAVLCCALALL